MKVYEHSEPGSLRRRAHPWTVAEGDSACRYHDFRARPELIRSSLEDFAAWSAYPAADTFYRLLEWMNGSSSVLESNDCAFVGPAIDSSRASGKRLSCSGRLMILYRDLPANTSPERVALLTQAIARGLAEIDPDFEWGAMGVTITATQFTALPGPPSRRRGQQLMLSFWAWGDAELDVMTNLDRTFENLTAVLAGLSDAIVTRSPAA